MAFIRNIIIIATIVAVIGLIVSYVLLNYNLSIPLISSSSNNNYQAFKAYISNATGIPLKNITNMTSFPDMINDVIFITPNNIIFTKIPYNNSYVYATNNFSLIFPSNALLFNITNNSIANVIFVVVTKQEYNNINFTNLSYQESLPRITIPYYISRNNLTYNFKIYNPNNYPNITIEEIPINTYIIRTFGIEYQGNLHLILYK